MNDLPVYSNLTRVNCTTSGWPCHFAPSFSLTSAGKGEAFTVASLSVAFLHWREASLRTVIVTLFKAWSIGIKRCEKVETAHIFGGVQKKILKFGHQAAYIENVVTWFTQCTELEEEVRQCSCSTLLSRSTEHWLPPLHTKLCAHHLRNWHIAAPWFTLEHTWWGTTWRRLLGGRSDREK